MADDGGFPPTQVIEQTQPIFQDDSGAPLNVFVDPGAVANRPKLVRNLRRLGAHISIAVAEAQLLLVDPHTPPGRQFIRDWGQDSNKAVLDFTWAHKSINAGRALLQADDWGGCVALDDGGSSDKDEDEDEEANPERVPPKRKAAKPKSPLPTPRLTPTHRTSAQTNFADSSGSRTVNTESTREASQQSLQISAVPLPQPPLDSAMTRPSSYLQSVPSQAPMPLYHPPPTNSTGQPTMQPQTIHTSNTVMAQASQPSGNSVVPSQQMTQDVMNYGSQLFTAGQSTHRARSPPKDESAPNPFYSVPSTSTPVTVPSSQNVTPRAHHKPKPSTNSKGKSKDGVSTLHARHKRSPSSPEPDLTSLFPPPGTPSTEADVSTSSAPALKKSPRPPCMVFTSSIGAPLSFFVQVDLTNRSSVVTKIKKNRGVIVSDNATADYVILDSSREKDFAILFNSTVAAGNIAIRAAFVHDCVDEGALLDTREYVFSDLSVNKRKRPLASPGVSTSPKRKSQASKSKATNEITPKAKKKTSSLAKRAGTSANPDPTQKSLTPPPAPQSNPQGRYLYTDPEHQYALYYAKRLLERDVHTSNTSIAGRLHKKMPWHTAVSWRSFITAQMNDQLDIIRQEMKQPSEHDLQGSPSKKTKLDPTPGTGKSNGDQGLDMPPTYSDVPDQEDFRAICEFFAFGYQSSGDDNEIWDSLANHRPCQSQPSWTQFYLTYKDQIDRGIDTLVRQVPTKGDLESTSAVLGTDALPKHTVPESGQDMANDSEAVQ